MSAQNLFSFKKVVSLAGVAGISAFLALPVLAQTESSPANSNSPTQCSAVTGQVTPSDSPTGGATMESMQANGTQAMDQSNINMTSPYGASSQANEGYAGSQNLQANQSNMSDGSSAAMSYRSAEVTPTFGPAGGYTMERFRQMDGEQVASADMMNNRQAYNSSYQSNYQANRFTPSEGAMAGPAGGFTASSLNNNNMGNMEMNQASSSSSDGQYSASNTMRPLPGSMSSDQNRPASEMTPEASQSLESRSSSMNSIYRVGPSGSSSSSQYNSGRAVGGC